MSEATKRYQLCYLDPKAKTTLVVTISTFALIGLLVLFQLWLMPPIIATLLTAILVMIFFPLVSAYWFYKKLPMMTIIVQSDTIRLGWPGAQETVIQRESILWAQYGLPRWKSSILRQERLLIKTLDEAYEIHSCVFDDPGRQNLYYCYNEIKTERDPVYNNYWS